MGAGTQGAREPGGPADRRYVWLLRAISEGPPLSPKTTQMYNKAKDEENQEIQRQQPPQQPY
jgi:hypothetical protein